MSLELKLRGGTWHVQGTVVTDDGRKVRVRKSTGFERSLRNHASQEMHRIFALAKKGDLDTGATSTATVDDAIDTFLGRSNKVGATDHNILENLGKDYGKVPLSRLSVRQVQEYCNRGNTTPSTVRRKINSVNAMLVYARDMGLDAPSLSLKKPKVDDARLRWLTEEERDGLIAACGPEIKGVVTFLFFTGARLGEAFQLNWRDVSKDGQATLATRKGRSGKTRTRAVPLVPQLTKLLGARGRGTVFLRDNGKEWERDRFYDAFYPVCERVGIEDFRPHDMRHTFASLLVQRGASLRAVADLLGHSSLQMVMRYAHLAPSHLRSTIELLGCDDTKLTQQVKH